MNMKTSSDIHAINSWLCHRNSLCILHNTYDTYLGASDSNSHWNFSQLFTNFPSFPYINRNNTHIEVSNSNVRRRCGAKYWNTYRYIMRCCCCFARCLFVLCTQMCSTFTQFWMRIRRWLQLSMIVGNCLRYMWIYAIDNFSQKPLDTYSAEKIVHCIQCGYHEASNYIVLHSAYTKLMVHCYSILYWPRELHSYHDTIFSERQKLRNSVTSSFRWYWIECS